MALSAGFMMWRSNLISSSTAYREISTASSSDVEAIKDVLHAQQQLLTKLYGELDEERELSSSAADEAMSMILRLQAEKSQLKMEASQYKREAEEKMCLAEESLAIFEDLVDQKEAEIAYLEFQVKFYKDKLLDMGYTDVNIPEYEYSDVYDDNNSVTESEHHHLHHHHHRHSNPILNNATRRRSVEIKKCHIPLVTKKVGASGGDLNSHWEHIKKLDEQVKKISHNRMSRSAENTNSKNRPFRSSSVPPPDIQDSMAVSPPKHGVLAKMDLPNIPKCPVPINV